MPGKNLTEEEFVDDVSDRAEYEGAPRREMDRGITARGWKKEGRKGGARRKFVVPMTWLFYTGARNRLCVQT